MRYACTGQTHQYPAVGGTSYSYNDNGCQTGGLLTASFDVLNRMTQAVSGNTTVAYCYDPTNRQAQKAVNSVKTGFLYDGQQLIAEYDNNGDLANRYIRGNRLDEVFIKIAGSTKAYLHHDRLGSVIAQTDDEGAVQNVYKYGPFGETASLSGTPFGYTGQRFDAEIGLYNYKARYYAPAIGRFLQPDPIGYAMDDLNLYAYVGNNAVNLVDSLGLQAIDPRMVNQMAQVLSNPARIGSGSSAMEFGGAVGSGNAAAVTPIYSHAVTPGARELLNPNFIQESGYLASKFQYATQEWHSHPNFPGYGGEIMSPQDIIHANGHNLDMYLLTPSGWVLNYQGHQMSNVEFYNLPFSTQVERAVRLGKPAGWFNQKGEFFEVVPLPEGQYGPLQVKPKSCGY